MRIVVFGAGAVGSVLGGILTLDKHDVLLVCRDAHARAIKENDGLRLHSATGEYVAHLAATTDLKPRDITDETVICLAVQSHATRASVDHLIEIANTASTD